jgi:FkbM family methyltransferase
MGWLKSWLDGRSRRPATGSREKGAESRPPAAMRTRVPGRNAIELVAYYPEFAWYYPECELQTKRWFVERIEPDWVIFDVGANIGYYSILFSQLAPRGRVYAFEPTSTIDMLRANVAHHGCANVTPMQLALGMGSGRLEENIFRIWGQPAERQPYDFSTVDDVAARIGLTRLDCIKIDCDSFDFEVLRGADTTLRRYDPWIVVELNHALAVRNQSAPEALEWLAARGYDRALVLDHDNFVLRRSAQGGALPERSVALNFETRPISA